MGGVGKKDRASPVARAIGRLSLPTLMRVEFDRDTCIGMFQCVDEWEKFLADKDAGKADLQDGEEADSGVFVREVPEGEELDAEFAGRVCPVDAITVYDDDGDQLVP